MDSYTIYTSSASKTSPEVNVSTTFFPAAILPGAHGCLPDVVLCSSDKSFFYVHRSVLLSRSSNSFNYKIAPSPAPTHAASPSSLSLSSPPSIYYPQYASDPSTCPSPLFTYASPVIASPVSPPKPSLPSNEMYDENAHSGQGACISPGSTSLKSVDWDFDNLFAAPLASAPVHQVLSMLVEESSAVLNIVLHLIYGMTCARYGPDLETIASALYALERYGVPVPSNSDAEIWCLLLQHAPSHPTTVYAIAASHGNHPIATVASRYTLSASLDAVSEGDALRMGPIYLRLLFRLHVGRHEALHRVIKTPPKQHTGPVDVQQHFAALTTAWALAVSVVMHAPKSHNTSAGELQKAFGTALPQGYGSCVPCRLGAQNRIVEMTRDWLAVRSTI